MRRNLCLCKSARACEDGSTFHDVVCVCVYSIAHGTHAHTHMHVLSHARVLQFGLARGFSGATRG